MLMTRIRSESPATCGRRQQMPRTIRSISTPACDARYSASIVLRVDERVHLRDDARGPARARACSASRSTSCRNRCRMPCGATISLRYTRWRENPVSMLNRSLTSAPIGLVAGEEADVGVDARGLRVVVAGAEVHVAADAVGLVAHDERDLGVRLEALHAVGDVHAERLQRARPVDVVGFLEPRLQLDEHRHLDAALRGFRQRAHDRRRRPTCGTASS